MLQYGCLVGRTVNKAGYVGLYIYRERECLMVVVAYRDTGIKVPTIQYGGRCHTHRMPWQEIT